MEKLVEVLRQSGFRASRTHFEAKAVRTDARLRQVIDTIQKLEDEQ